MTSKDAIDVIKCNYPITGYSELKEALDMAIQALQEVSDHEIWIKNRLNLILESRDPNV